MKKHTRMIPLLIAVLSIVMIGGCSNSMKNSNTTIITVWTAESHSKNVVEKLIDEFNKTKGKELGIKVEYQVKTDVSKMVELGSATGDLPDMFAGGNIKKLSEDGVIIALEDIEGGKELVEKYKDYLVEGTHTYNGKTYKLPFSSTIQGLLYNKDMFKAAGIVDENGEALAPATYEELRETAAKLTNPKKQEYGMVIPIGWGEQSFLDSIVPMSCVSTGYQNGYNPKTGEYNFETLNDAIELILAIKNDGSVLPGVDGMNNDTARARFASGGIGMKFGYSFDVGVLNDQFPAEIDWGVAPIPVKDKNNVYMQPYNLGAFVAINKASVKEKDAKKILAVYEYLHSDEFLKLCYEQACYIPYKMDIVRDTKYTGNKKGWAEFTKLLDISSKNNPAMPYSLAPDVKLPDKCWVSDIWSQKSDYKKITQEATERVNKAVSEYKEKYPDENYENYIIENFDIKR